MCHFFVYFLSDDENAALLCAHMKFMKTKGSGCLCTSRLWLKLWSLAALMAEGEGPHGKSWDCTAPRQKKKKKTSLLSFSERQNVALPSLLLPLVKIQDILLALLTRRAETFKKRQNTVQWSVPTSTIWPKTVTFRGHECFVCVCEWKRTFMCIFFSSSDLFLICIQSQTIFKDLQMCRCVFREHPPQHSITITVNKSPAFNTVAKWELPLSIFPFQHFSLNDILNITEHRNTGLSRVM